MKTKWTRRLFFAAAALVALALAVPGPALAAKAHKFAVILPGPIEDADYNFRGYEVAQDIKKRFKIETSYSERISPADAERVAREYISSGFTIIGFHGGQYVRLVQKLAPKFPEVTFVMESSGKFKVPGNVWNIHRHYFEAFYPFGVLAGLATKTNKVSVIVGIPLPDFKASINTISDALKATNPKAELTYSFTGNQNDPVKARQTADAMIANGVDFIINMVNLGVYGVVEAAKKAKRKVLVTTFYTDKTDKAPKHFAGTLNHRLPATLSESHGRNYERSRRVICGHALRNWIRARLSGQRIGRGHEENQRGLSKSPRRVDQAPARNEEGHVGEIEGISAPSPIGGWGAWNG